MDLQEDPSTRVPDPRHYNHFPWYSVGKGRCKSTVSGSTRLWSILYRASSTTIAGTVENSSGTRNHRLQGHTAPEGWSSWTRGTNSGKSPVSLNGRDTHTGRSPRPLNYEGPPWKVAIPDPQGPPDRVEWGKRHSVRTAQSTRECHGVTLTWVKRCHHGVSKNVDTHRVEDQDRVTSHRLSRRVCWSGFGQSLRGKTPPVVFYGTRGPLSCRGGPSTPHSFRTPPGLRWTSLPLKSF